MSEVPRPPGCPEPSILAAFAEKTLDAELRRQVERHIADCPECPIVLAETIRFLQDAEAGAESDAEAPADHWWRFAAAVAAAALCITAVVWQVQSRNDPLRRVKRIAATLPSRPVEGRLIGFSYAPFALARSGRVTHDLALRGEAERLAERSRVDAWSLHAGGVALLLSGDTRSALPLLVAASSRAPHDATIWSDLAAAYVARGTVGDRAQFVKAVQAADRATAITPALAPAHFNRAVALERLGRMAEAVRAYQRAIELDRDSEWSKEAAQRISRLGQ